MKTFTKRNFPLDEIRRFVEPGPIVLVSSQWKGETNIMTMGWHTMMSFSPALVGCYVWPENHSFGLIRKSKECVVNIPTVDLAAVVVGIGNTSGRDIDKFAEFGLTAMRGTKVRAPLIAECYANIECRVADTRFVNQYSFFILEAVKAHAPAAPKYPRTLHYRGEGVFMSACRPLDGSSHPRRHPGTTVDPARGTRPASRAPGWSEPCTLTVPYG